MSFNSPPPIILKIQKNAPPLSHSSNHFDDVMVRNKPDSAHHHNNLKDDEAIIAPLDVMVRTKPNVEHHEDNNTKSNHKRKLTQSQRQHIHDSKHIMSHLGHSNKEFKNFSTISIDKKSANASCLKSHHSTLSPIIIYSLIKQKSPFCLSSYMK
ncbi:hypothetical protein O181_026381 [Austropuccinia psidii MF-1]|uniref:Uncharacterized protein n=1 Tax=Austropuccinia psidii MF-1 TaxID=1389203 RepID=A0A9Q3CQB5_9BASI|nr:hypothetical protein [Austropuccinia psidii MF-1]